MHHVLECTVRDVTAQGGFKNTNDEEILEIAERHAREYQKTNLSDLQTRAERFGYLFTRNLQEMREVVLDVARELRLSEFTPVDEELKFGRGGKLPPIPVSGKSGTAAVDGSIDRVDLYEKNGQYYCRVVDYKTGPKDLDYAELQKGHGLQMLIYLFALKHCAADYYKNPVIPAGVLYLPAKQNYVSYEPEKGDAEIEKKHAKDRRRKGLVLSDGDVLAAMEQQEQKEYLPQGSGGTADRAQFALMEDFVAKTLRNLTDELFTGATTPNPIRRGAKEGACQYCEFESVCHKDFINHAYRDIKKIKPEEFWASLEGGAQNG